MKLPAFPLFPPHAPKSISQIAVLCQPGHMLSFATCIRPASHLQLFPNPAVLLPHICIHTSSWALAGTHTAIAIKVKIIHYVLSQPCSKNTLLLKLLPP